MRQGTRGAGFGVSCYTPSARSRGPPPHLLAPRDLDRANFAAGFLLHTGRALCDLQVQVDAGPYFVEIRPARREIAGGCRDLGQRTPAMACSERLPPASQPAETTSACRSRTAPPISDQTRAASRVPARAYAASSPATRSPAVDASDHGRLSKLILQNLGQLIQVHAPHRPGVHARLYQRLLQGGCRASRFGHARGWSMSGKAPVSSPRCRVGLGPWCQVALSSNLAAPPPPAPTHDPAHLHRTLISYFSLRLVAVLK